MKNVILPKHPDHTIENKRQVNANRNTVYKAVTLAGHLSKWWGPNGFTNTFNKYELKEGGLWDFVMHGPDGNDYHNQSVFIKIEEPKVVVFNHIVPPEFQAVITLKKITPEKTQITFQQVFETAEACAKLKDFCLEKNEENLDRLEAELEKMK
ncbi:ATPase [Flavobacterium sp. Sd200]|uniref:SRPBCC domain-containing protein n=1 Tax=Flavobacterium sp. Sd200 TaxID=2692211 RepID=UPI0013685162|nr:SRPBCC domain-containing protein [Flavobacterium sp. Sd200]MXN91038.1 ATPase [Flavobacterium sp. Sd200]